MSNYIVSAPVQPFTLPNLFKGIFNGYIYIGIVNSTDVTNNQIQAYSQAQDGTLTELPQPIRTNGGGFPVDESGNIVKLVTKEVYSLLIQDKSGNQVWYHPNVALIDPQTAYVAMRSDMFSAAGLVYSGDWASGLVVPSNAMTDNLGYWHEGMMYSVGTNTGFTSNDFDADLSAGKFVSKKQLSIIDAIRGTIDNFQFKVHIEAFTYDDPEMLSEFNDGTLAFKRAIAFVRNLPNPCPIYSGAIETTISERLFFGPRNSADVITPDGFPTGVCLGFCGLDNQSTVIKAGAGLKGDVCFDLSGLRDKYLRDFHLISDSEETAPSCGILTARFDVTEQDWGRTSNEWGDFTRVVVDKYFEISAMIQASTEETLVERCRFRNDHINGKSPVLLTCNLGWSVGSAIQPSTETTLPFSTGTQSTLHQVHKGCDYYYGAGVDSTQSETGMIIIHGCNQVRIETPFFNNNAKNVDCVRVVGTVPDSITNNIHVIGANCHKETKSGIRFVGQNKGCSWIDCTTTIGSSFTDAEIVIDGFTSSFFSNRSSSLQINQQLINSTILNCDEATWDSSQYIQNTTIDIESTWTPTGATSNDNNFNLIFDGDMYTIQGAYSDLSVAAASTVITSNKVGRYTKIASDTTATRTDCVNAGQSEPIHKTTASVGSTKDFDYEWYGRGSNSELRISRGGFLYCDKSTGGVVLTSSNGTQYRLVVNDSGALSTVVV